MYCLQINRIERRLVHDFCAQINARRQFHNGIFCGMEAGEWMCFCFSEYRDGIIKERKQRACMWCGLSTFGERWLRPTSQIRTNKISCMAMNAWFHAVRYLTIWLNPNLIERFLFFSPENASYLRCRRVKGEDWRDIHCPAKPTRTNSFQWQSQYLNYEPETKPFLIC